MHLLTLKADDAFHIGVERDGKVLDLTALKGTLPLAKSIPDRIVDLLAGGEEALQTVQHVVDEASRDSFAHAWRPLNEVSLAPVVPDGNLVLSGSMNSHAHNEEMGGGTPDHPCAFHKVRSALSASGDPILLPVEHADMVDWEGELCVVIGRRAHNISVENASSVIAGYTLMNDISAREFVKPFMMAQGAAATAQAWERNVLGKNFPTFAPIGPYIVTKDEFDQPFTYHMETVVNGEVMQSSTEEDLVFGPAEMIAYFSRFYVLMPGDVISMGSPPGVGVARKPQIFLKSGDVVQVRATGLGTLTNTVAKG